MSAKALEFDKCQICSIDHNMTHANISNFEFLKIDLTSFNESGVDLPTSLSLSIYIYI
jgi:hypothetical protein